MIFGHLFIKAAALAFLFSVPTTGQEIKELSHKDLRSTTTDAALPVDEDGWENDSRKLQTTGSDSRLVAYVPNWKPCPSAVQTANYTHINIAFAVTYTWNPTGPVTCDNACTIQPIAICNNAPNPGLVSAWKAAGKKVILSFGGATMGGHWLPAPNGCWEQCFGKEDSVVSQLDTIVRNQGFDGVDIDYEYYYETAAQQSFLTKVTTGLRSTLPAGSIVSHAPIDADLVPGKGYYEALNSVSSSLSFLNVQYYNGITNAIKNGLSGTGNGASQSAISHFKVVVDNLFGGNPTKIVFGFCLNDCNDFNSNGNQAAAVMSSLKSTYPCNGGAMFWESGSANEINTAWSTPVSAVTRPSTGCSIIQSPTAKPTSKPTTGSFPTIQPTSKPTATSDPGTCGNGERGNGKCPDPNLCCSQWGWCDTGPAFCGSTTSPTIFPTIQPTSKPTSFPTIKPTSKPTTSPTIQPTSKPTLTSDPGTCGNGEKGNGKCPDPNLCCSQWGWCDTGPAFCGSTTSPTSFPTIKPTSKPTSFPTIQSTNKPTTFPTIKPTNKPTTFPTIKPTNKPTTFPTIKPTNKPTTFPTIKPTNKPTTFPTIKPTSKPTTFPTIKPTNKPTTFTTNQPTSKPTLTSAPGTCGNGERGNGKCSDPNLCCSQWGWCDIGSAFCGSTTSPTSFPTIKPTSKPTSFPTIQSTNKPTLTSDPGTCGNGQRGNGKCPDPNLCCSQWGWCGTGSDGTGSDYCGRQRSLLGGIHNFTFVV